EPPPAPHLPYPTLFRAFDERNRPTVKLIDFGLVKLTAEVSDDSSVSQPGMFLGTPRYASPEQFSDGRVDIRSDIYALGIVLWERSEERRVGKGCGGGWC